MTRNSIHPSAYIAPGVILGEGNSVGPFTSIEGDVRIGDGNWIGPNVTIGTPAQYTTSKFEFTGQVATGIEIGSRCVIREYCTVHQPSKFKTIVEDDCYFMAYCHISHDTVIRRGVAMANNTQIGGFTEIQEFATIGLSTVIHQYSTIGAYVMVGMATLITKDVPPFVKIVGSPPRFLGINEVGLKRNGFSAESVAEIVQAYQDSRLPETVEGARPHIEAFLKRRSQTTRKLLMPR
ncbi:MAG: UDP-N-acetylglucosamine acyltransferase [Candidatus Meridianibacter frigidus]|nr:MAG: UDP-N-acetylglucosamine acyltransferase [Candidatus Eremiobacteraeota bacterium]